MIGVVISMDTKKKLNEKIDELDNEFDNLKNNNQLDINSIEDLALKTVENVNIIINNHIEELLSEKLDEKELINKKTKMARTRISIKKHWKKKIRIYFTNWKNNNL